MIIQLRFQKLSLRSIMELNFKPLIFQVVYIMSVVLKSCGSCLLSTQPFLGQSLHVANYCPLSIEHLGQSSTAYLSLIDMYSGRDSGGKNYFLSSSEFFHEFTQCAYVKGRTLHREHADLDLMIVSDVMHENPPWQVK